MFTDEQTRAFVAAINTAAAELDLSPGDAAALLCGCAIEAAAKAWGERETAWQLYAAALRLTRESGDSCPSSSLRH